MQRSKRELWKTCCAIASCVYPPPTPYRCRGGYGDDYADAWKKDNAAYRWAREESEKFIEFHPNATEEELREEMLENLLTALRTVRKYREITSKHGVTYHIRIDAD